MAKTKTIEKQPSAREPFPALRKLDLSFFRSYQNLKLDLPEGPGALIVLAGQNGAGKTNLLEAISYLAPGRGLRGARLQDVTLRGHEGPWAVSALLSTRGNTVRIGCGIEISKTSEGEEGRARRIAVVDDEKISQPSALANVMSILWLTPKMDRLFQEAPSERRRFFDQLAAGLFPEHASQVSAFERAMRERLRLLTGDHGHPDEVWLSALERRMAEHAVAIAAARLEMLSLLRAHLPFAKGGAFPLPEIDLSGDAETLVSTMSALEAEEAYLARLKTNRGADKDSGRTLEGPHRTDLLAAHPEKEMAAGECSTGEQKAMLIGVILAAARLQMAGHGPAPVLLLDEIAAHLDHERREALFQEVEGLGIQTWMTGTDEKLFAPLTGRAAFFKVGGGSVTLSS